VSKKDVNLLVKKQPGDKKRNTSLGNVVRGTDRKDGKIYIERTEWSGPEEGEEAAL